MAQQGLYRDPPNRRMAYDEDGSLSLRVNPDGSITQLSNAQARDQNTEAYVSTYGYDSIGQAGPYFTLVFPELRDVSHSWGNLNGNASYPVSSDSGTYQSSTNTTNGLDGTWTNLSPYTHLYEATNPAFRTGMVAVGSSGSKGFRFKGRTASIYAGVGYCQWHVYGNKSAGQTPHRIDFCDSGGSELLIDFDYGDQPRSSDRIWSPSTTYNQSSALYLKNRSSTKQATSVDVTFEVITSDFSNFETVSKDNITFGTIASYATINPLAIVGPIYVKHSPTVAATLGLKVGRLQVTVGTWL